MEYYSAIKKSRRVPFAAAWMELETLILSEVSQKEKDKYHMISLISGSNIRPKYTFPQKRNSWTWSFFYTYGCHGRGSGMDWEPTVASGVDKQ